MVDKLRLPVKSWVSGHQDDRIWFFVSDFQARPDPEKTLRLLLERDFVLLGVQALKSYTRDMLAVV